MYCLAKEQAEIWDLPQQAHCFLLHLISRCLPMFDELC